MNKKFSLTIIFIVILFLCSVLLISLTRNDEFDSHENYVQTTTENYMSNQGFDYSTKKVNKVFDNLMIPKNKYLIPVYPNVSGKYSVEFSGRHSVFVNFYDENYNKVDYDEVKCNDNSSHLEENLDFIKDKTYYIEVWTYSEDQYLDVFVSLIE